MATKVRQAPEVEQPAIEDAEVEKQPYDELAQLRTRVEQLSATVAEMSRALARLDRRYRPELREF